MEKERINHAEAYNPLIRDDDVIREPLEIEVQDYPLAIALRALRNTQCKDHACDFDFNVEYIPSDEDNLDNNKLDLYLVIVPLPIMSRSQTSANYSFHTEVWNASIGAKLYTFEGHNIPIYSVGQHSKCNTYTGRLAHGEPRAVPAPWLKYNESGRVTDFLPQVGPWNMIDKRMVNCAKAKCWLCINFARNVQDSAAHGFCRELAQMCNISEMACPYMCSKEGKLVSISTNDIKVQILTNNLRLFGSLGGQTA